MKKIPVVALIVLVATMVLLGSASGAENTNRKFKIFIVHSYSPDFEWDMSINEGIFAALDGKGYANEYKPLEKVNYEHKIFYMNTKEHNSEEYLKQTTANVLKQIKAYKPDVVITSDENATLLVGKKLADNGHPVSFCCLNGDPVEYGLVKSMEKPDTYITGVLEHHNFNENIRLARQLKPGAKSFYVVFDDGPSSRGSASLISKQFKDSTAELKGVKLARTFREWKGYILSIQDKADFIFPYLFYSLKYDDGTTVPRDVALKWLIENSRIPEISVASFQVQDGFLASVSMWGASLGYEAAAKAMRILRGERPQDIPVTIPKVGSIDINLARAKMLGIEIPFDLLSYATVHNNMRVYEKAHK